MTSTRLIAPILMVFVLGYVQPLFAQCDGYAERCDTACDGACDNACGVTGGCDACRCQSCACQSCGQSKCSCLRCRATLLDDRQGIKSCLAEHGIAATSSLTQYYQGVASGGGEQRFRYGSKFDLYLTADTEKLGLWKGGSLAIHAADWQFGQNVIGDAVGLAPVNTQLLTPLPEESFGLTNLMYAQQFDGGIVATFGRANIVELWGGFFPDWGMGRDGFTNTSLGLPLTVIPSTPLVTNAAGIIKAGERGPEAAFVVLEGQNSPTTVGLDFPNGIEMIGLLRRYSDFGDLAGTHTLLATYATGDYTSFDTQGWAITPPGGVVPAEQTGTWSVAYLAEQRLWQDRCNDKRYTRLFGYLGFADQETSPFKVTAALSLEAFGLMDSRPQDRMGMGYFYNGLNSDFKNVFSFITPLHDVHGGEVYYNAQVTPWFHVTFDLQAVEPDIQARDTALVLGMRAKIDF